MLARVLADQNDVNGVRERREKCQNITAIEVRDSGYRHGEKVQSRSRGECAQIDPQGNALAPEQRKDEWNEHNARAGDKSGIGSGGVAQAGGLKGIPAEHEKSEAHAGKDFFALQYAEDFWTERRHANSGQRETERQKDEYR